MALFSRLEDTPEADARRLFDTNFWGMVHGSLTAVKTLKATGGALINVGSIASDFAIPLQGMYCASKHAAKAFTDTLRVETRNTERPRVGHASSSPPPSRPRIVDHLGNTTGREAKLPKPHYAPEEVAHAILHAAVHPQRDIYVGGTGRLMSLFANAVPQLADKVSARFGEEAQLGDAHEAGDANLHASTGHSATHNDQDRGRTSYYTRAMLDPASPLAAANAIGGALFDAALSMLGPKRR